MGAYQFKVIIKGSKPPIWRRMLVPQGITFEALHRIIQTAFCWSDCHLYEFEFRSKNIRIADIEHEIDDEEDCISSRTVIDELVADTKRFTYTYDFGDNWEHTVEVEKVLEEDTEPYARVIKYKGDVIPEDCGGIWGYYELLDTLSDPEKLAAYNEENGMDYRKWAESQGMGEYDADRVNEQLKQVTLSRAGSSETGSLLLADIFRYYDKESILEIAKRHDLKVSSKLKKEELIRRTTEDMLLPEVMGRYFLCARDVEIGLFEQVLAGDGRIPGYEEENMEYLYAGGYVTESGGSGLYVAADDTARAYEEMNTEEFQKKRRRISLIGDYLCAANALYAVTPVSVVLDMFNRYEAEKLTEGELLEAYEKLHEVRPLVELVDGRFADAVLVEQNTYGDIYRMQKNVPYYMPTPIEIRFMADNGGFLMGKELQRLGEFLTGTLKVNDEQLPYILREVQSAISVGAGLQEVIDELETYGIRFGGQEDLEKFTSCIMDVWNNTRMVQNRGYTPYEMVVNGLDRETEQRRNTQKIYPNDPCPCGSGRKYKKCCGKNV